jgi:hypothetical protein
MREDADGMKQPTVTKSRAPSKGSTGDVKHHHARRYARAAAAQTAIATPIGTEQWWSRDIPGRSPNTMEAAAEICKTPHKRLPPSPQTQ